MIVGKVNRKKNCIEGFNGMKYKKPDRVIYRTLNDIICNNLNDII